MENRPSDSGLQKSVDLDRGIFIIRYSAAEDEAYPPKVTVASAPGSDAAILPIVHPDEEGPVLWQPGAALVVQAVEPGRLLVEVSPTRPKGSAAATVKIETLNQGKPGVNVTLGDSDQIPAAPVSMDLLTNDFRVLGHVAGRGDVFVAANEWIGGPAAPSRIEGLAVEWPNKPRDLSIRYAVSTAKPDATSNTPVDVGTFVGTRGRALALLGVTLELSGPRASSFELVAEAVFLGSPVTRGRGEKLSLAGPTGREPLVGFRLGIEPIAIAAPLKSDPQQPQPKPPSTPAGRVRVFRSSANKA
jgi:hypothetical protein